MIPAPTSAREQIASDLQTAGLPAYPAPLGTTPVPSIVIQPGEPWISPSSLGKQAWAVMLRLSITVPAIDTATSLAAIESLAMATLNALPAGCDVQEVSAPQLQSLGQAQGTVYAAEISLTVNATNEGTG